MTVKATAWILCVLLTACTQGGDPPASLPSPPAATRSESLPATPPAGFELVGHSALFSRGMNAGLAVHLPYAYVGNRTDASNGHPHPGVLIVDVRDPAALRVAGAMAPPPGGTSTRELRVWPEQDLLIVLELHCGAATHRCNGPGRAGLRFFDIRGTHGVRPRLIAEVRTDIEPHEMYLWIDRTRSGRALLYVSTDTPGNAAAGLVVFDVSEARAGRVREIARWSGNRSLGGRLHSLGLSADGRRAYLAHLAGGFAVLDTSRLAAGQRGAEPTLLTPPGRAVRWSPGPHSAVPVGTTGLVLTTDEVYGGDRACPWGWARIVDASDPSSPRLAGELRAPQNRVDACTGLPRSTAYSYSSHVPTIVGDVAFISWHAAGLVAGRLSGGRLTGTATFVPEPIGVVGTEDPRLTAGPVKIAMWSTPIVADGLVYVVDVRNGLYVLRYRAAGAGIVTRTRFGEGNSNAR